MNAYVAALALSLTAIVTGCASDPATDSDSSNDEVVAKGRVAEVPEALFGTFAIVGATDDTIFNWLALNADHTFVGKGDCRQDLPGIHCKAVTSLHGKWRALTSGPQLGAPKGAAELEFTDSAGQKTTYFYALASDRLSLSASLVGDKSVFDKSSLRTLPDLGRQEVCADANDNSLGRCPENLACVFDGPGDGAKKRCLPGG